MIFAHVVYRPREETSRFKFARESWHNAGIHTLFYTDTISRGQNLEVPLINDVINYAFSITGAQFILYTNSDIALVKETMEELQPFLKDGEAYYVPNRQVKGFDRFYQDSSELTHLKEPKWGADTFLISRSWWEEKSKFFADFLLGYHCWDEVLIDLIGKNNKLPSIAFHEDHDSYWKSTDAAFDKGLLHNVENAGFNSLAIIIPFYCTDVNSLRLRNFLFVLRKLKEKWNGPIFIGLQHSPVSAKVAELISRFNVKVCTTSQTGELSNKSKLTNVAVGEALRFHSFTYILQLDADLYNPHMGGLIWNWVRGAQVDASFIYSEFFFLTRKLTETVTRGEKLEVDTSKLYRPIGFGPGGFLVRTSLYQKVGGMPEQFVGWGLEDTAFGDAIKAAGAEISTCKSPAFHLYHENDRHINRESFAKTLRFNDGTFEECKYLASDKFAIFNLTSSDAIEVLLRSVDSVSLGQGTPELLGGKRNAHQQLRDWLVTPESSDERYKRLGFTTHDDKPSKDFIEQLIRKDFTVILIKLSTDEVPEQFNHLLSQTASLVIDLDYFSERTVRELEKILRINISRDFEIVE